MQFQHEVVQMFIQWAIATSVTHPDLCLAWTHIHMPNVTMTATAAIVTIAIGSAMARTIKSFSAASAVWGGGVAALEQASVFGTADDGASVDETACIKVLRLTLTFLYS